MFNMIDENAYRRAWRAKTNNAATKKYEKTKKGFLMRLYRNMQSRISGVQQQKHHLYRGKQLLDRQDFYEWALDHPDFHRLFAAWEQSGYSRKLTPSVNRIDPGQGYTIDNMEWITHSENSKLGGHWSPNKS